MNSTEGKLPFKAGTRASAPWIWGRYRQIPSFGKGTIRKFSSNVSQMKKLAARDFEDILQVSVSSGSTPLFWFSHYLISVLSLRLMACSLETTVLQSCAYYLFALTGMGLPNFACTLTWHLSYWIIWRLKLENRYASFQMLFAPLTKLANYLVNRRRDAAKLLSSRKTLILLRKVMIQTIQKVLKHPV